MCGIAGLVALDGRPPDRRLLEAMIGTLAHRGPDGSGSYVDSRAGLAHSRLAIIDVAGGRQPMTNEDGTIWITFNGEIFNYVELREELLGRGHSFRTVSDTEVILHLYEEEGDDCVDRLNGQWAFAIWDSCRCRLFLSRDRMGVRPLFYAVADRTFLFGSEIKGVLAHPAVSRDLDLVALDQVFTYWSAIPPRTTFRDVRALPPAHSLVLEEGQTAVRCYWQLDFPCDRTVRVSERQCADRLLEVLTEAIRLRLRSDVPVGAYVSGGLDSAVTTALAQQIAGNRIRTFSIAFDDPEFDESREQEAVVRFLGTDHTRIRCSATDVSRVFPELVWHAETPVVRTGSAPMYLLARAVREAGIKVILTGEGADEVLGGYDIFKETKIRSFCAAQPESRIRPLLFRRLYPYLPSIRRQSDAYLAAFFRPEARDLSDPFFSHRPRWESTARLKLFFSDAVRSELAHSSVDDELLATLPPAYRTWCPFHQAQFLETAYLLPGYILSSQGDRAAMAHGVEGRFPFLDPHVIAFAATLPPRLKMKVLNEKYLLKMSAANLVPEDTRARRKQPYRAPEAFSFFHPKPIDYVEGLLSPSEIVRQGLFQPSAVTRLVQKCRQGHALSNTDNMALVGILSTQLVCASFGHHFTGWRNGNRGPGN